MKVINGARSDVKQVWGKQQIKDAEYRPLHYLLEAEVDEGLLIHNTVSGELVLLEGDEKELYRSIAKKATKPTGELTELIEKHFLVPLDYDEHKNVLQLRKLLKLINPSKAISGYTILPTTYCNARCFYCYQSDFEHIHMSDETVDKTIKFIEEHHGDQPVHIGWYGGEPLVGVKQINKITQGLKEREIKYSSSMISNSYLFDEEMIQTAKDLWHLNNIQVTLDGREETYNKVKSYSNVQDNPYQRVMNNIENLLKADIRVVIRMNLDYHNYDDLELLIEELNERFKDYDRLVQYVHILFDDEGYEKVTHTEEDRQVLLTRESELNSRINSSGCQKKEMSIASIKPNWCMADNDSSVIIYPDGTLAKCEHYPEENLGNLDLGFTNVDRCNGWKDTKEFDECGTCPIYPTCIKLVGCSCDTGCNVILKDFEISKYIDSMRILFRENCTHKQERGGTDEEF